VTKKVVRRDGKNSSKPTLTDVRQTAATATSGLGGVLNIIGSLARAAGVVVNHVAPGGAITARGLDAIGGQLVEAAQALGAASGLIGGSCVVPNIEIVDAEVVDETKVPRGRKPRKG
jgi:hypothetical protein